MPIIRIKNGFADRNGLNSIEKTIQLNSFSHYTRVAIKNKIIELFDEWESGFGDRNRYRRHVSDMLAKDVFCCSIDSVNYDEMINELYECIDTNEYFDILSIIEYLSDNIHIYRYEYDAFGQPTRQKVSIKNEFNELFEHECVGYRFVGNHIENITNKEEIKEIENAVQTPYESTVNFHVDKALLMLSETGSKDYENCIKESVTALEGLCALITQQKGVLSDHIKYIAKKYSLHPAFEQMVLKLYAYSCDENGIRHEKAKNGAGVSFEEAKYILVLCCSTINYLLGLCCKDELL